MYVYIYTVYSVEPILRREETVGRASDPRKRALGLIKKEEDRGSPVWFQVILIVGTVCDPGPQN